MQYDPQMHHRRTIRLPAWDYREAGAYFVTICTYGRECILVDHRIRRVLRRIWARTVAGGRFPGEGEFVVMPNHVHGIVWIGAEGAASGGSGVGASRPRKRGDASPRKMVPLRENDRISLDGSPLRDGDVPSPRRAKRGSLGAVIASFKTHSAIAVNRARNTPGAAVWQRNYYERIIREEDELLRIREYIRDNPRLWAEDPENPTNLVGQPLA